MKMWNIEETTGYKPITTFWQDFTIADMFGTNAIEDTYRRVMNEWKSNYKFLTELVMVLNWKIWEYYETNETVARLYNDLWMEAQEYALDHLVGNELKYYLEVTD